MKRCVCLLAVLLIGCHSSKSGGGGGAYSGPPEYANIRNEMIRQAVLTGYDPAYAQRVNVRVERMDPSGDNGWDWYFTEAGITAHAATYIGHKSPSVLYRFAYPEGRPGQRRKDELMRHEVGHFLLVGYAGIEESHPPQVTLNGKRWNTRDIIGGARWPAMAWITKPALGIVDTFWDRGHKDWTNVMDRVIIITAEDE